MWLLLPVLLVLLSGKAETSTWRLGPGPDSVLKLEVYKTGLMSGKVHVFEFPAFTGEVKLDQADPARSSVTLEIDAAALELKDKWLSQSDMKKVKSFAMKDMLDVEHHPKITFTSTRVERAADGSYRIAGLLTIRGMAKPVSVEVKAFDQSAPSFAGSSKFNMTLYGLKPPSAALGAIGTKDEMSFTFRLQAPR